MNVLPTILLLTFFLSSTTVVGSWERRRTSADRENGNNVMMLKYGDQSKESVKAAKRLLKDFVDSVRNLDFCVPENREMGRCRIEAVNTDLKKHTMLKTVFQDDLLLWWNDLIKMGSLEEHVGLTCKVAVGATCFVSVGKRAKSPLSSRESSPCSSPVKKGSADSAGLGALAPSSSLSVHPFSSSSSSSSFNDAASNLFSVPSLPTDGTNSTPVTQRGGARRKLLFGECHGNVSITVESPSPKTNRVVFVDNHNHHPSIQPPNLFMDLPVEMIDKIVALIPRWMVAVNKFMRERYSASRLLQDQNQSIMTVWPFVRADILAANMPSLSVAKHIVSRLEQGDLIALHNLHRHSHDLVPFTTQMIACRIYIRHTRGTTDSLLTKYLIGQLDGCNLNVQKYFMAALLPNFGVATHVDTVKRHWDSFGDEDKDEFAGFCESVAASLKEVVISNGVLQREYMQAVDDFTGQLKRPLFDP